MKTIPQVRNELLEIAETELRYAPDLARKIKSLVKNMYRRKNFRRVSAEHAKVTTELISRIKKYAKHHPHVSYASMGQRFNVSIGRVSEALVGKRAA